MRKHLKPLLLTFLSGLLLAGGWPVSGFTPFLFIGFVPLLFAENIISSKKGYSAFNLFCYSYFGFFTWNILTTWWIKNASFGGAAMAILANSLLMSLVFFLFHKAKQKITGKYSLFILPVFWISFEFFHLDWDLTFPWLTLGNGLADITPHIQWYEYTGVFGGSLWILIVNILVFYSILSWKENTVSKRTKGLIFISLVLIIPFLISYQIYSGYKIHGESKPVLIVQPNIDPYQKFNGSYNEQLVSMVRLGFPQVNEKTDYLVFPETAITENIWENQVNSCSSVLFLKDLVSKFPQLNIITGASTFKAYLGGEKISSTARKSKSEPFFYDAFNTALQINKNAEVCIYHKSKLVPGVERMPFPALFKPFEDLAIDLGGTSGSLGTQEERTPFISSDNKSKIAPVICYESIYGEYVTDYIKNGAQCIFIITNDGWWGDTPGYKQHLAYGTLRAIETRKDIIRSANTGISCYIDQRGDIHQALNWWVPGTIKVEAKFNSDFTFYTRYGDYIAKIFVVLSMIILLYYLLLRFMIIKKL
jgi:apolipoprotein N-acyltransferase